MPWLPDFSWLSGSLLWGIAITVVTVISALLALWWQHDKALKNPWSNKSLIMAGICLAAGIFSIINLVQEDAESKAKDQQMAFLTSEITGYRTTIQSQAIAASSTPVHAMFVFHPKGLEYNRGLKEIEFEPDDPSIKPFFTNSLLSKGEMNIDINTLFRYQIDWSGTRSGDNSLLTFSGFRTEVWDRMGFTIYSFRSDCVYLDCKTTIDPDGESGEKDDRVIDFDVSVTEGVFGSLDASYATVGAINLKNDVTWADIVRAVGAPFQSSSYGKGAYGAMRFPNIGTAKLRELKEVLKYQDLYFGFEFLSQDKKRPGCMMARLPVSLEFWRFERDDQTKKNDVAAFLMKAGTPSMEIVDCTDHWQHDDRVG